MPLRFACVVEGHGDALSVPDILRRLVRHLGHREPQLVGPFRVPKSTLVRQGELERVVERAARRLGGRGSIVVVLDADDDLPCLLGPALAARAAAARPDVATCVVVANREKEAWYLAALASLRGHRGVPPDAVAPENPEAIRDAKGALRRLTGRPYSETTDQAAFGRLFDLDEARRGARSFDHFYRGVSALAQCQAAGAAG